MWECRTVRGKRMRLSNLWLVALALVGMLIYAGEAFGGIEQYPFDYVWRGEIMRLGGGRDSSTNFGGDPAVADLNKDGYLDVVSGTSPPDKKGYVWANSGKDGSQLWEFGPIDKSQRGAIMIEDVNGDGLLEVIFGDDNGTLYCVSGPYGSEIWRKWGYRMRNSVAFFDVNSDGRKDIIVAARDPTGPPQDLTALDGMEGDTIWVSPARNWYYYSPMVCDIEGDGGFEVLTWHEGHVYVTNAADGTLKWNMTTCVGECPPSDAVQGLAVVADLNSDGVLDFISHSANSSDLSMSHIYAYTPDLEALATDKTAFVKFLWDRTGANIQDNEIAMGDLDGDGVYEVVHAQEVITKMYNIVCRRATDGEVLWNVTRAGGAVDGSYPKHSNMAFADYDNDGILDVIITGTGKSPTLDVLRGTDGASLLSINIGTQSGAAVADVDNDGFLEILVNGIAWVGDTDDDGTYTWALPTTTTCEKGEVAWGCHMYDQLNTGVLPMPEGVVVVLSMVVLGVFVQRGTIFRSEQR